jgi:hypothetical protein
LRRALTRNGHDQETDVEFSTRNHNLFEELPDTVTTQLGSNHDAGIENQPYARIPGLAITDNLFNIGGEFGIEKRSFPPSFFMVLANAVHSERDRRGSSAARRIAAG